jgi:hypothetical protein
MKIFRTATIFAAVLVCAPAQATQFVVQVGGTGLTATVGSPNSRSLSPANAPSPGTMSDRLSQLVSAGYFPAGGQASDMTRDELSNMLAAYLGVSGAPGFDDVPLPAWAAALAAGAALGGEPQIPGDIDAYLRSLLGAANETTIPIPIPAPTAAQLAEQRAQELAETQQHRLMLLELQGRQQVDELARAQAAARAEREKKLAEMIRRQEQARPAPKPAPNKDRFEDYPFSGIEPYTPTMSADVLRSGDYHGFARGTDFADSEISGAVALRFDLDNNALSGQFDFGSSGMLHVTGSVDADDLYMHLDGAQRSFFGSSDLDLNDAFFHNVGFFGPEAEEIGGDWAIENGNGNAGGRFATARTTP